MKRIKETVELYLSSNFSLSTTATRVGNLATVINKDGYYKISSSIEYYVNGTVSMDISASIFINGIEQRAKAYAYKYATVQILASTLPIKTIKRKLKKGDLIEIKSKFSGATPTSVFLSSDNTTLFIEEI